ncbi:MAG: hypothetical protein ABIP48_00620 [Planctomycetota bacterium]
MKTLLLPVAVLAAIPIASVGAGEEVGDLAARIEAASDPTASAELLWRIAPKDGLTDGLAARAAELLGHEDPFVRALAEWAIATKVGRENGGQEIVWPRPDPPDWFRRWSSLSADFLLEADYARLAVVWDIHRDGQKLLGSVGKIIERAEGAASEVLRSASPNTRAMVAGQLDRLASIRSELAERVEQSPDDITGHRRLWLSARRAARPIVLANPAVDFNRIVFVRRHPAHSHRNITGSQYPWCHKPGGDISIKTGLEPSGEVRDMLLGQLGPGHVHGMDLWWNADRVVFAYARQPDWPPGLDTAAGDDVFELRGRQQPTHLYEVRLDGAGLRQLTSDPYWSDFEPTYCANGDVVFASDRSGRSSECGKFSADHTVVNLYAVSPDGKNLRRLSDNKDIDRYPHSLQNGLIAYTRWEYQERHFFEVHSIWQVRPDGTKADAVANQHLKAPFGLRDARSVPGSSKLVAIATGHHTFAYGPVVLVDPTEGINVEAAIRSVTPHTLPQEGPPPKAMLHEADTPTPPPWGAEKLLGYEWLIQPILDRRCVGCHGATNPDGGVDLTAARADDGFYQSYRTLFGKTPGAEKDAPAMVSVSNRFDGSAVSRPKQFGSHRSRLIEVLLDDNLHQEEARLSDDEWLALVTWIDANAPYYDTFYNRRPADGGEPRREIRVEMATPFAARMPIIMGTE